MGSKIGVVVGVRVGIGIAEVYWELPSEPRPQWQREVIYQR